MVTYDVSLAPYTTMKTMGHAQWAASCHDANEMQALLSWAHERELPVTFLGGGSNVIVSDYGIKGLVILTTAMRRHHANGELFCVQSGLLLENAIDRAIEAGLSGLELLGGIPGTVGGAIYGNAGTEISSISDKLYYVDYLTADGKIHRLQTHADEFSYRHSPFMDMEETCIWEAGFRLEATRQTAQLRLLKEKAKETRMQSHQYDHPSSGCIFKNPIGLSAGALIDQAGCKGMSCGGASVSTQHANFIVNTGNATAKDIWNLSETVRKLVREKEGIDLQYEVRFLGEW